MTRQRPQSSALLSATALDKAIAWLAPMWGRRRMAARYQMAAAAIFQSAAYTAGRTDRTGQSWTRKGYSAETATAEQLLPISARARDAVRNNWAGRSIVGAYRRGVVGTGISFRAAARNPDTMEDLEAYNREHDELWDDWASRPRLCDVEGRMSLTGLQEVGVLDLVTVGECFATWSYQWRPDQVGLSVQLFEVEQLDQSVTEYQGRRVIRGIEVDEFSRAVAYHVTLDGHPLDAVASKTTRIPAYKVQHLMRSTRVRQVHGESGLSAVLEKLWRRNLYDTYELIKAQMYSCIGAMLEYDAQALAAGIGVADTTWKPGLTGADGAATTDANGNPQFIFEPGMVLRPPPGRKFSPFVPNSPGGSYAPFVTQQDIEISAGSGLDHQTVTRDYSRTNFSGQREGKNERDAETDPIQQLMVDLWLREWRELWTVLAIMEKRLAAPEFFADGSGRWRRAYLKHDWQGPAKRWIDPAREAAAAKIILEQYLGDRRSLINQNIGGTVREVFAQRGDERAMAKRYGHTLPEDREPRTSAVEPRPERTEGVDEADRGDEEDRRANQHDEAEGIIADALAGALDDTGGL